MKFFLLFTAITGGLLSFNSYAASCPVGATIPAGTYKPYYSFSNGDGTSEKYINIGGCEYWAKGGAVITPDGFAGSLGPFVSTGNPVEEGVAPAVDETGNSPEPDIPEPSPDPDEPIEPQLPDYSKPAYPQDMVFVNNQLAYINSHTPEQLYKNYHLVYDSTRTWADNRAVYQALVNKLHDVYPPTYKTAEMFNAADKAWQNAYWQSVPKLQGVPDNCKGGFLLPDECVVYKPLMDSYSNYVSPGVSTVNGAIGNINGVNDPDYYSYSDYKNGITRCDINPMDTSCNKPDDSGSGDGNNPDDGNTGDSGDNPDSGTDTGTGGGNTDNNDNGDVVAAIERFHADNNASHKQLLDEIKKKDDYSDATNKIGDLFTNGISDFKSGAESSVNSLIDGLEKYAPGLKGFGLPDGFYSNSGRCVPLDMSFTVSLPFYNYSAPVNLSTDKLCKSYDGYPRELLRLLIYMLTAFVLIVLLKQSLK
ncbi:hypothetical protein GRJ90_005436 [Salmonella enterica]|nr:hypothetical protein [Salmonella enterica]